MGVLIPIALIASRQWRAFITAALTVVAVCAYSVWWSGPEVWQTFTHAAKFFNTAHFEPQPGFMQLQMIANLHGLMMLITDNVKIAVAAQGVVTVVAAVLVAICWRVGRDEDAKMATLLAGTCTALPYIQAYDMPILLVAVAFLVRTTEKGWSNGQQWALVAALFASLNFINDARIIMPLQLVMIYGVFGYAVKRCLEPAPVEGVVSLGAKL